MSISRLIVALVAVAACLLAVAWLEAQREGLSRTELRAGLTPVTLTQRPGADGPLVVVAHGFAGSRAMMDGFSLTLARAGYRVAAFDFEGHGDNPVPMAGDVRVVEGTTARLVAQTRAVLAAARAATGAREAGLLGHSMASDVVIRAALAEGGALPVVAVSAYSEAITPKAPARLLLITGAGEPHLRAAALRALRLVDPSAEEGETARAEGVVRRAVVAPWVEHVGVLHSRVALAEARAWFDAAFGRVSTGPVVAPGPWLCLLLGGIVALVWPLSALIGPRRVCPVPVGRRRLWLAALVPALLAPLVVRALLWALPGLGAPVALALQLGLFGAAQLAIAGSVAGAGLPGRRAALAGLGFAAYGICVFGLALDRYGADFWPAPHRAAMLVALMLGAVPFLAADAAVARAGGPLFALVARILALLSLGLAIGLGLERLFTLFMVPLVLLGVYLVFGRPAAWVAARAGPLAAGAGQGLILAWALGASLPLHAG